MNLISQVVICLSKVVVAKWIGIATGKMLQHSESCRSRIVWILAAVWRRVLQIPFLSSLEYIKVHAFLPNITRVQRGPHSPTRKLLQKASPKSLHVPTGSTLSAPSFFAALSRSLQSLFILRISHFNFSAF